MPPKAKKQEQPDDELMKMVASQLENTLRIFKEKAADMKSKRNYIQMDRDMVEELYQNTQLQIKEIQANILNKESDGQKMQIDHNTQVRVYLQKLKLLEYQLQKANISIEADGEQAKGNENKYYENRMKVMKKNKLERKKQLAENQDKYIQKASLQQKDHQQGLKLTKEFNEANLQDLQRRYQEKLAKMKEELQLKLRVQVHELEERKNLHINELMKNHEEAFAELKNYYNEITRDNLKLIKDHRTQIKKINQNLQKNKKRIAELRDSNNQMKQPLRLAGLQRDKLKSLLRQFEKHKMSRENYKSKLYSLKEKVLRLEKEFTDLSNNYDRVVNEKKDLTTKFQKLTQEVKKHAEMYNVVLTRKLNTELEQLEQREAQLNHLIESSGLDTNIVEGIKKKVKQSIELKNQTIKNLKYSIHHATKAYNDAIRVYEAKLVKFGIPSQELGFQPLNSITSTMPAGLVSS